MALLAGVDIGTSGVKVGVFSETGELLGLGRAAYQHQAPKAGWAECDPEMWWDGLVAALQDASATSGIDLLDIAAIGIGVIFPAIVPLDADNRPLAPAILYCDQRSVKQVDYVKSRMSREEYQKVVGNTLVPGTCAITSMLWIRDNLPEVYNATATFAFANTYVNLKLTGRLATDPSNAALSGLVDINWPTHWSVTLGEKLELDVDKLPPIKQPSEVIGTVTDDAATACGLRAGIPVVCGAGDAPLAVFGAGTLETDTMTYVAGSTDCVGLPMVSPSPCNTVVNSAYIPVGRWLAIGTTTSSGVSVEWFLREILGDPGEQGLALMNRLAEESSPGANGVIFCPYLQGERTPIWDPLARGTFFGLTASTTRADMARAVFEGVAFALRQTVDCMEEIGSDINKINAVGGGTRSGLWNQIKADIMNRPISVLQFQETGILGAALIAGRGAGVYRSLEHAVNSVQAVLTSASVEPREETQAVYDDVYKVYERIYSKTSDLMWALSRVNS